MRNAAGLNPRLPVGRPGVNHEPGSVGCGRRCGAGAARGNAGGDTMIAVAIGSWPSLRGADGRVRMVGADGRRRRPGRAAPRSGFRRSVPTRCRVR